MIIYVALMLGCAKLVPSSSSVSMNESIVKEVVSDTVSSPSEEEIARLFVQAINTNNPDIFLSHVMSVDTFYSIEDCTGLSEERQQEEQKKREEFGFVFQMMKMGIANSIQQVHQEGYSISMLGVELSSLSKKKKGEIKDEECSLVKDVEVIQMDVRVNKNGDSESIEELYTMRLMKIDGTIHVGQMIFPEPE